MQDAPKIDTGSRSRLSPASITAAYAVAGALWILFSDRLAARLAATPDTLLQLNTAKGWFFILVTSILLYGMLRRYASARQRQEARLHEERNLLNAIVEGTSDAIFVKDREGRYLLVNTACARIFAKPKEEAVGETDARLFPPDMEQDILERDRGILESGTTITFEEEVPVGGRTTPFLTTKGVVRDTSGNKTGIFGIARDISDIKAAQKTLHESEKRIRNLFEQAADGIFIITPDHRYVDANEAGLKMLGYSREELLRFHVSDVLAEGERSRLDVEVPVMMAGTPHLAEWRHLRKDGTTFPAEVSARPISGKEYLAIVRDLTMRRRAEEEIRKLNAELEERVRDRTARLEASNRELEAFSYSVSHDLRAPLRGIDGFSQALMEDCGDRLDEAGKSHLARVRAATLRMAQLIDDLLNLSRVSRAEMRLEPLDLSAIARSVAEEVRERYPGHTAEVVIAERVVGRGDARLLRQVLQNLFDNAFKFTGRTPSPRVEFGAKEGPDGATWYFVRDNGAGFDMAYADKLFGTFQRLHAAVEFPGTGVGLAIVQRIVHRHGGQVRAEGRPDGGATFQFTL